MVQGIAEAGQERAPRLLNQSPDLAKQILHFACRQDVEGVDLSHIAIHGMYAQVSSFWCQKSCIHILKSNATPTGEESQQIYRRLQIICIFFKWVKARRDFLKSSRFLPGTNCLRLICFILGREKVCQKKWVEKTRMHFGEEAGFEVQWHQALQSYWGVCVYIGLKVFSFVLALQFPDTVETAFKKDSPGFC
uniref:Uncharacterized protein n=1 Tax=Sphaerodactylus townsendi TaxID=933632 RepID=A0ACB8E966_9SAUR